MKSLFLLPLIILGNNPCSYSYINKDNENKEVFVMNEVSENHFEIIGIKEDYYDLRELRLYKSKDYTIDKVNNGFLSLSTSIEEFMLTDSISLIQEDAFKDVSTLKAINYTGSLESFAKLNLNIDTNVLINEYACDEGFLNYWYQNIRISDDSNICDVSKSVYLKAQQLFDNLCLKDKETISSIKDGDDDDTILDALNYLKDYHHGEKKEQQSKEVSKDTMITFILIIASVGMTFICIFYLLRERKIIN